MKKRSGSDRINQKKPSDKSLIFNILFIAVFALILIFFISIISAAFTKGNPTYNIEKTYGKSQNIKGWVNLSLSNEPANSTFEDSRSNKITLIDLLKKNASNSYSCNPTNCAADYTASSGQISKTFNLGLGNSAVYGLKFTGNLVSVDSINFILQSNAPISCANQIEVDVLDDGVVDFINNKSVSGSGCGNIPGYKNYGCFSDGPTPEEFTITTIPFCQKMNLTKSPGFGIGAWVKNISGTKDLTMALHNSDGNEVAKCNLLGASASGSEISCDVNYTVAESREHYVCIYTTGSGSGEYRAMGYSAQSNGCGFRAFPPQASMPASYQIFSEGKKFAAPSTLQISNSQAGRADLNDLVQGHIEERYGNDMNCPESTGCVIPIRFISGIGNHEITINNLNVNYTKDAGPTTEHNFYNLTETPAKVSTQGFKKIYLDLGGFTVPGTLGDYDFSLKLNSTEIFSTKIEVKDIPAISSLNPLETASAFPTEFMVKINSSGNITKYLWNFGDGGIQTTTTSKATHTYSAVGNYNLSVTITDSRGLGSSKTFEINVSSPKNLLKSRIENMKQNIGKIETQITDLSLFAQQSVDSVLGLNNASAEIGRLETAYNAAATEAQYNALVRDLLKINMPNSIEESKKADSISFFFDRANVNLGILQEISGGAYNGDNEENYIAAVVAWNQENLETKVDFTEVSGDYGVFTEPIVKVFEFEITEKKPVSGSYFLVMPNLDGLEFAPGTITADSGDYVYVDLNRIPSGKVSFHTTANVDFSDLPAFISPGISSLAVTEFIEPEKENSRWIILVLAIVFLLIIAFVAYIILQEWYKRRYESYLFKNRNDLYNMVTYVHHAKKRGIKNSEIAEHLRKAHWSSEQVSYVMKKYAGKRTGMIEIPFFNFGQPKE